MTKHLFQSTAGEQHVNVDCGWDRPCQHSSLTVELPEPQDEDEEMEHLYCSMYDPRTFGADRGVLYGGLSLQELQQRAEELCLRRRGGLIEALRLEGLHDVGNRITRWAI
ncbi:hypothetical protein [Deinococcus sonorensis]|uniref:Uncharacterized protein n=2 Tax=Deinococcus sonorensis TaxID=309891 RepID=A0AAU7U844_9DEIO